MDHTGSERATQDLEREWAARKVEVSRALDAAVRDAIAAVLDSAADIRRAMDAQAGRVLDEVREERERLNREVAALGRERDGLADEIAATRRAAEDEAARIREGAEGERADLLRDAEQRKVELTAEIRRLEQQLVEVSSGIQALLQEQIGRVRAGLPSSDQLLAASTSAPSESSRPAAAPPPTVSRPPASVPEPPALEPEPEPTFDSLFDDTLTVGEVDQLSHELGLTESDEEGPVLGVDEIEIEVGDLAADRTIDAAEPEEPIGLEPLDELESVDVDDEESLDAAILGIDDGSALADELANLGVETEREPPATLESEEELELALESKPDAESDDDLLADLEVDQTPDPTEVGLPAAWPPGGLETRGMTVSQAQQDAFAALAASFERRARAEAAAVGPVDQQIEVPEPPRRVTPVRDASDATTAAESSQADAGASPGPARAASNGPQQSPTPVRSTPQSSGSAAPRAGELPRQAGGRPAEGGASQRVEVAVTGTPSFARALELQRGIQRTAGVKQVQALQFERGTLVLAVEHDASVDLPGVLLALPNNLEMVDASAERLELRFPKA